ncbi:RTC4-like domain-containing protein, partial [Amylostereum chailletii]
MCPRHQFETEEIPKARARGWPTEIDFDAVQGRVEGLYEKLRKIRDAEDGAREASVFWQAVMKEVRAMGSRAVAGVKGQFDNFERTQPGYYGEKGSMILHQTLYNLFPPAAFDAESIAPLNPTTFIQQILVPEAALALIMEDTGEDVAQARRTMRESVTYGVTMFPDSGDG